MQRLFLFSFFLIGCYSFSQETHFGVTAGISISTMSGDNSNNIEGRIGYHAGVILELPINKMLRFSPELLFSSQGAKLKTDTNSYFEARNDYLNLPLLLRFYSKHGFMAEAGPQVGILISSKVGYSTSDISTNFKSQDYGFNLGVGYSSKIGLGINLRYYFGLAKIDDFDNRDFNNKNRVFQVSFNYFFN